MWRKGVSWLWWIVALGLASPGFAGQTIVVVGQDDALVDRPNLQSAMDSAGPGDTVELVGVFQLDGEAVLIETNKLRVRGREIDNDGDGARHEDWLDGEDNDGDGAVDEDDWDTQIRGILLPDGSPDPGPAFSLFNRGFSVRGVSGSLNDLRFEDLMFTGLRRGIALVPDFEVFDGFFCDEIVVTGGSLKNANIENNRFDNVDRGFEIFGAAKNVKVERNLFTNNRQWGALLVGEAAGCREEDGTFSPVGQPIGTPLRTRIDDNVFVGPEESAFGFNAAVGTVLSRQSKVRDNVVLAVRPDGFEEGIFTSGDDKARFEGNFIDGADIGIEGNDDSPKATIKSNVISNSALYGVGFFAGASNYRAEQNDISGSGDVDYFLDETTSENRVRLEGGQTATDLGVDNDVN